MANAKALLLHDDPRVVALARALLGAEGFDVASAPSAFRLLEVDPDAAPDLLLLGIGGLDERDLEIVAALRRRWAATRILILFPPSLRDRAARCLDLGADGYLPEPFYPGELTALARSAADIRAAPGSAAEATPDVHPSDEALAKLAAGVAHSIRNPLQILELQLGSYETDGRLDLVGMREQFGRIAGVAEALVRFAGRRKLNTRLIDVNALVQRVFAEDGRRRRSARLMLCAERLETLAAPDMLRAAADAFHDRAQRVSPEGTEITVQTSLVELRGERWAEIVITDAGPLLGREALEALFDPFPDADQIGDGTGMEMAAATGIVRNHGGTVTARTARTGGSEGTSIVVRLPLRGRSGAARSMFESS